MSSTEKYACYMFVNKRLKMGAGKIAAQVAHGMDYLADDISNRSDYVKECWRKWKDTYRRIIVLVCKNEEEMEELYNSYPSCKVIDMGLTQVDPGSFTVLALFPKQMIEGEFTQKLL